MKLRTKIINFFIILIFLGAAFSFAFTHLSLKKVIVNTIGNYNVLSAKAEIDSIDRIILRRLERWESYAQSNADLISAIKNSNQEFEKLENIDEYIQKQDLIWTQTDKNEITPFMEGLINSSLSEGLRARADFYNKKYQYDIFPEFFVTNKYGANVAETAKTTDYNQADEYWWQIAKQERLYVGDVEYDTSTNTNALTLGVRVDDRNGDFLGIIKVVYNIQDIFDIIAEAKRQGDEDINVYLLNKDGKLIYSISDGFGKLEDNNSILEPFKKNKVNYYIGDQNGKSKFFSKAVSDGYRDFKGLGWSIVITHNSTEALAPLRILVYSNSVFIALMVSLVLALGVFVSNLIIRPLDRLSREISIISGGLNKKNKNQSQDEITQIAESFTEMEHQEKAILNILDSVNKEKNKVELLAKDLEKFQLAANNVSDHIIITDATEKIIYANPAAYETTGYSFEEMKGKTPSLWGEQMDKAFYEKLTKTLYEDKKTFIGEANNKRKNGELYTAEIKISPILDNNKNIAYFVGIERDITKAKIIDRAKTEFVSLASHQLKTPLSIINWYTESLMSEDLGKISDKQKDYLKEIYVSNKRMIDLVNSLLNVSRIDMGTFAIDPKPISLKKTFEEVINEFKQKIIEKGLKISQKYDEIEDIPLDENLIRIVLTNLFSNAFKYTNKGGEISVIIKKQEKDVLISVADTGCGIPDAQKDKIFTKLFRADNAREIDPDGNGLGLYIVKAIVDKTKGKIWFDSTIGKGTTFYVTIPLIGMEKNIGVKGLI